MGKTSIAEDFVFPSETGTPISPDNIATRYNEARTRESKLASVASASMIYVTR